MSLEQIAGLQQHMVRRKRLSDNEVGRMWLQAMCDMDRETARRFPGTRGKGIYAWGREKRPDIMQRIDAAANSIDAMVGEPVDRQAVGLSVSRWKDATIELFAAFYDVVGQG